MIPKTPQSSSARFSDPLSRSPATEASATSVHLEVGPQESTRRVNFLTLSAQANFLDHSIDTPPTHASNSVPFAPRVIQHRDDDLYLSSSPRNRASLKYGSRLLLN